MAGLTVLGHFEARDLRSIQAAAAELKLEVSHLPSADSALDWLASARPEVIVVQAEDQRALQLSARLRLREQGADVPIFGVHVEPRSLSFAHVLNLGLDDLVQASDSHALVVRVREALRPGESAVASSQGVGLVLEPDELRRAALARALRAAGYSVRFVESADSLASASLDDVTLLAVSGASTEQVRRLASRRTSAIPPIVFSVDPREEAAIRELLSEQPGVRTLDLTAPPENVIFLVNELENPQIANKRASPRELYGEAVRFRVAGQDRDDIGYTYNVSAEGMFVRTLAPPTQDEVWLELNAPRSIRRVRLEGTVMWRRPFRVARRATVPPGFGIRITGGSRKDQLLWVEGCGLPPAATSLKQRLGG